MRCLPFLLLHANQVVSTDRLIDQVWGEQAPGTVKTVLQGAVSNLRKALGADSIQTRPAAISSRRAPRASTCRGSSCCSSRRGRPQARPEAAAAKLREALGLWRGPALADFLYEPFAQASILRLEQLRLAALEDRIEADLGVGADSKLVGELEELIAEHPLRERLRAHLMLALYRSGRQAEALEAYQRARRALVDELGIEPAQALQELERAILRHDPALGLADDVPSRPVAQAATPDRAILSIAQDADTLDALVALAVPLAAQPPRELLLSLLVSDAGDLGEATRQLEERRVSLASQGFAARGAAFTTDERGSDAVRLAAEQNVDLLLLGMVASALETLSLDRDLADVLVGAPCDVGLLVTRAAMPPAPGSDGPVLVPFGGADDEWAAAEVAAWIARATGAPLRLLGTAADPERGRRDASRLLAAASLAIQSVSGIGAELVIVPPGPGAVVDAAGSAALVVMGLSDRWREEGLGTARLEVARGARPPVLLVRGGVRPGGLAPQRSMTRFTWSLASQGGG